MPVNGADLARIIRCITIPDCAILYINSIVFDNCFCYNLTTFRLDAGTDSTSSLFKLARSYVATFLSL